MKKPPPEAGFHTPFSNLSVTPAPAPPPPPKVEPPKPKPVDDAALFRAALHSIPAPSQEPPRPAKAKGDPGFHTPFASLKLPVAAPVAPPQKPAVVEPKLETMEDALLFDDAMRQVAPMQKDPRGRLGPLGASLEIGRAARPSKASDEAEAYAELADLVDGTASFDIASTDEYIEGVAEGLDPRIVKKLRRGEYSIQAHLDLHGATQAEARIEVEQFLEDSRARGRRCVLIVHGRGLHSKESVPVLKERLQVWLSRGRIARGVLAFASARPTDGGTGAVYVLLRK